MNNDKNIEKIVLGGGCFWCLEAVCSHVKGVLGVVSGYAGGKIDNPNYQLVSTGKTNHAEVVEVSFDPNMISLQDILHIFFTVHDPTTPNKQGNDIGSQYRSIILYKNNRQKEIIEEIIKELKEQNFGLIVTEVFELKKFYPAEEYHQKYFEKNPDQAYCQIVIKPKIDKFMDMNPKKMPLKNFP